MLVKRLQEMQRHLYSQICVAFLLGVYITNFQSVYFTLTHKNRIGRFIPCYLCTCTIICLALCDKLTLFIQTFSLSLTVSRSDVRPTTSGVPRPEPRPAFGGSAYPDLLTPPTPQRGSPTLRSRGAEYSDGLGVFWECPQHAPHVGTRTFSSQQRGTLPLQSVLQLPLLQNLCLYYSQHCFFAIVFKRMSNLVRNTVVYSLSMRRKTPVLVMFQHSSSRTILYFLCCMLLTGILYSGTGIYILHERFLNVLLPRSLSVPSTRFSNQRMLHATTIFLLCYGMYMYSAIVSTL